jgi:hypothetical protein
MSKFDVLLSFRFGLVGAPSCFSATPGEIGLSRLVFDAIGHLVASAHEANPRHGKLKTS